MDRNIINAMGFKQVADLFESGQDEAAKELLRTLQDEFIALHDENEVLKRQLGEVAEVLDMAESLEYDGQKYWLYESGEKTGPYCQLCYDRDGMLVRLQKKGAHWECHSCKNIYLDTRSRDNTQPRKKFSRMSFKSPIPLFVK